MSTNFRQNVSYSKIHLGLWCSIETACIETYAGHCRQCLICMVGLMPILSKDDILDISGICSVDHVESSYIADDHHFCPYSKQCRYGVEIHACVYVDPLLW